MSGNSYLDKNNMQKFLFLNDQLIMFQQKKIDLKKFLTKIHYFPLKIGLNTNGGACVELKFIGGDCANGTYISV